MIELVLRFLYIGLFSIGGGLTAISLIQSELSARLGWLSPEALADMTAIAELTPGPLAVNAASFVGMRLYGLPGAAAATIACVLPGCLLSCLIARANARFQKNLCWKDSLKLLRAAAAGLVLGGAWTILRNALCPVERGFDWMAALCFSAGLAWYRTRRPPPMLFMPLMGAVCGLLRLLALRLGVC